MENGNRKVRGSRETVEESLLLYIIKINILLPTPATEEMLGNMYTTLHKCNFGILLHHHNHHHHHGIHNNRERPEEFSVWFGLGSVLLFYFMKYKQVYFSKNNDQQLPTPKTITKWVLINFLN